MLGKATRYLWSKTTVFPYNVGQMTYKVAEIIQKILHLSTRVNVLNYFPPPVLFRWFDVQLVRSPEGLSERSEEGGIASVCFRGQHLRDI